MLLIQTLATAVAVTVSLGAGSAWAQSAQQTIVREIDYIVPSSLDDLWKAADLVAEVEIIGLRPNITHGAGGTSRVFTEVTGRVVNPHKAAGVTVPVGEQVKILQEGGTAEFQGRTVMVSTSFDALQRGARYVLFLKWSPSLSAYEISHGPDGAFQVTPAGKVESLGKSSVAKAQRELDLKTFTARLMALSERHHQ